MNMVWLLWKCCRITFLISFRESKFCLFLHAVQYNGTQPTQWVIWMSSRPSNYSKRAVIFQEGTFLLQSHSWHPTGCIFIFSSLLILDQQATSWNKWASWNYCEQFTNTGTSAFWCCIFCTEGKIYFVLRNCTMNYMQEASSHTINDSQFHSE